MMLPIIAAVSDDKAGVLPSVPKEEFVPKLERYYNIFVDWIASNQLELLIALGAGTLIFLALTGLKKWAVSWSNDAPDRASIRAIIARAVSRTSRFFRFMVSAELVAASANTPQFLANIIVFLFTISAVFQVAIWAREIILGFVERRAGEGEEHETLRNAMTLIRLLVSFGVFAIAAIVILDNLGVDVTGLIAGLGVGGIAIGLAAQGIFSDLFAAISIIFDKPFRVGDSISYDTSIATVEKIGMKSTRLRSIGGEQLIISNAKLLEMEISNNTMTQYRRASYPIGVIYQTPPEKARAIPDMLKECVETNGGSFVRAGFIGFGASSIDFKLQFDVYSDEWDEIFAARHKIGIAIIEKFAAEGIEFAYPTQTTFTAAPDGTMIMPFAAPAKQKS